jgi:hypothetical protein
MLCRRSLQRIVTVTQSSISTARVPSSINQRQVGFVFPAIRKAPSAIAVLKPARERRFSHTRQLCGRVMPAGWKDGEKEIVGNSLEAKAYGKSNVLQRSSLGGAIDVRMGMEVAQSLECLPHVESKVLAVLF